MKDVVVKQWSEKAEIPASQLCRTSRHIDTEFMGMIGSGIRSVAIGREDTIQSGIEKPHNL
jgi:hypothetical protein